MFVEYELSSNDVILGLDLLVDDKSVESYYLFAGDSYVQIPNPDFALSISIQFTAARLLLSDDDYEHALVTSIEFLPCTTDKGRLLCLQSCITQSVIVFFQ